MAFPVFFVCTSHQHWRITKREKKKPRLPTISPSPTPPPPQAAAEKTAATTSKGGRKLVSSLSGLGSRALQVAKMMSWKKERGGDKEAVWKKTILMGDKCQPLNFSGRITYDYKGKLVQGFPLNDDNARPAVAAA